MNRKGIIMKKSIRNIIIVAIICVSVFFVGKFAFTNQLNLPDTDTAYLKFNYSNKDINVKLTKSEIDEIRNMVRDKDYVFDEGLSCGFTENISITFEDILFDDTVCVACDGCEILKIGKKIVYITPQERDKINEIFEKYGGRFPAV